MRGIRAAALLTVASAGCARERPLAYRMTVSPSFAPAHAQAIVAAADAWQQAVPELTIETTIAECASGSGTALCVLEDLSFATDPGATLEGYDQDGTLTFYTNSVIAYVAANHLESNTEMQRIATHEIGHALGLSHSADGNVMAPMIQHMALAPTADDIRAFWSE